MKGRTRDDHAMRTTRTNEGCLSIPIAELFALGVGFYTGYQHAKGNFQERPPAQPYILLATPPLLAATIGPIMAKQAHKSALWTLQKAIESCHQGTLTYHGKPVKDYPEEKQQEIGAGLEKQYENLEERLKKHDPVKTGIRGAALASLYTGAGFGLGYLIGTIT